ncbi:MAG: hypothetical protein LQ341_005013 [Variospora aurantia]|nr:MAG: hypothetical protein LQ341_005013 [Variospora aurantia]
MDRLRKALPGQRPASPSYKPLDDGQDSDESYDPTSPRSASSWVEYAIFLLLGVSMLWAWNMFLAASPYFQHRFSSSPYLLIHFPAYITSVSTATNLASVTILTHLQRSASYPKRIIASLCLNIFGFTCLALSTTFFRDVSVQGYFAFLMLAVFTASLATGLCQNGVFSYVSGFGVPKYTQAIMTGQAIAGVLPCIAQIVSVLSVPKHNDSRQDVAQGSSKSAFIYFMTATAVSVVALLAFLYLAQSHNSQSKPIETADGVENAQEDEHVERKVVGMWTLFKKLRYLALAVFLCFTVTMFFPIFTQQILSVRARDTAPRLLQSDCFIPLAFLFWNAGDLIGRLLLGIPHLTLFLFGLSNGYIGSSCMMGAGEWVDKEEREAAGGFMTLMLVGGLTAMLPAIIGISTQESSKGILDLSNELLALIFDELSRPDLKDVPQTCKALSDLAVSFLFTTAVISAFPTDIDVFKAISRRPSFSYAARTLFYDLQHSNLASHMKLYDHRVYEQIQMDFVETHGRTMIQTN